MKVTKDQKEIERRLYLLDDRDGGINGDVTQISYAISAYPKETAIVLSRLIKGSKKDLLEYAKTCLNLYPGPQDGIVPLEDEALDFDLPNRLARRSVASRN